MNDEVRIWFGLVTFLVCLGVMLLLELRSRPQFSLRALFIVITFSAVVMGLIAAYARSLFSDT